MTSHGRTRRHAKLAGEAAAMAGSGRTGDLPASHPLYGSVGGGYNDFRSCGRPLGLPIPYLRMQIGEGKGYKMFWKFPTISGNLEGNLSVKVGIFF